MLVPFLAALDRHQVTVYDSEMFGSGHLPDNARVRFIKGDVRDARGIKDAMEGQDVVIWLASLSNNEMCVREPVLHDRINKDAVPLALLHKPHSVKRFIYASSVAAYGSSDEAAVEDRELTPSTPYGEAKAHGEKWAQLYNDPDFTTVNVRSASVCGYSVHQRFDLTVNMMVHDACRHGVIKVNGGQQKRCHIHIRDICDAYRLLIGVSKETIAGQAFNFVAENQTVLETAHIVAEETGARIEVGPATDNRSYTVDGTKARFLLGFEPKRTVREAVRELKVRLNGGYWPDSQTNPHYMNMAAGLV